LASLSSIEHHFACHGALTANRANRNRRDVDSEVPVESEALFANGAVNATLIDLA
jgi:hypothetical protein